VKALVIGGGGADHAVTWKLAKSLAVTTAYTAPGNYGSHLVGANVNIPATDPEGLAEWARENQIDLTIVNHPVALAFGAVDVFQSQGLRVFGPTQGAARLESDKGWAKGFLERHGIPTPPGRLFHRLDEAEGYLATATCPLVIKSSQIDSPTNVVVARHQVAAGEAVRAVLAPARRGPTSSVLIEGYVDGEECSVLVVTDGETTRVLGTAFVYPNVEGMSDASITPGMGVISPVRGASDPSEEVVDRIVRPLLAGLAAEGTPYMGVLTVRVMLTRGGPIALSFKTRFADPEAQAILPRWQDDLYIVADAVLDRALNDLAPFKWSNEVTCGVVVASEGYPNEVETGYGILGLSEAGNSTTIFHNGTRDPYQKPVGLITPAYDRASTGRLGRPGGISSWLIPSRSRSKQLDAQATRVSRDPYSQVITADGRVLTVVGQGKTLAEARQNAYRAVGRISFTGCWSRSDIGEEPMGGGR
jgi:phosphoribosylamine--glycine ligase